MYLDEFLKNVQYARLQGRPPSPTARFKVLCPCNTKILPANLFKAGPQDVNPIINAGNLPIEVEIKPDAIRCSDPTNPMFGIIEFYAGKCPQCGTIFIGSLIKEETKPKILHPTEENGVPHPSTEVIEP